MKASRRPIAFGVAVAGIALPLFLAAPGFAFDSKGHNVIEATAYRTLVEGHGSQPPRPDVLRDLINDGALDAPWCFGWAAHVPGRGALTRISRLFVVMFVWGKPLSDR